MTDFTKLLDRLEPPQDGESPVRHRTGTVNAVNSDGTVDLDLGGVVVSDVAVLAGAAVAVGFTVQVVVWRGDLLVLGGLRHTQDGPFLLSEAAYFTASDTFTKADYPGLKAVVVRVQGGGAGGGGGDPTVAGESSFGAGGGAGGYSEKLILADALGTSETVTVGTGGAGFPDGSGGGVGSDGNDSSFGAHAVGNGGLAGDAIRSANNTAVSSTSSPGTNAGGGASSGDVNIPGQMGTEGFITLPGSVVGVRGGDGGNSVLGHGGRGRHGSSGANGFDGTGFGSGGGGGSSSSGAGSAGGGDGADGVVIVEVYV